MKNLYIIGGTMGIGKSTVCKRLKKKLAKSVFLDGDWCWDMEPFLVTDETKKMVMDNITHVLNNFLRCTAYENIIFCWVMHEQSIIDELLSGLELNDVKLVNVSLICSESCLLSRLMPDIKCGIREEAVIERSRERIPMYQKLNTVKIDVTCKTVEETAADIINIA